jgi:hypothetical protein
MLVWLMARSSAAGQGALFALRLIGATFVGPSALVGGPMMIAWGLCLHLATSVSLGTLFVRLASRESRPGSTMLVGAALALGALVLMTFVVLPVVNPTMRVRVALWPAAWAFGHLLFAVALAVAGVQAAVPRRSSRSSNSNTTAPMNATKMVPASPPKGA